MPSENTKAALGVVSSFLPVYAGIAVTGVAVRQLDNLTKKDKSKKSFYDVKPIPKFRL